MASPTTAMLMTQLYIRTAPSPSATITKVTVCLEEIKAWMKTNFLQLNSTKTEAILVGTPCQICSSPISQLTFDNQVIPFSSGSATNLGVRFDPHLAFSEYIKYLCKASFLYLRYIAKLQPLLSVHDAEKIVHAFISSRLDYCNGLFYGIPSKEQQKLQCIQNSAARILTRTRKSDHITPILYSLHWLPVSARIHFKILLLTHKCITGHAPSYLQELLSQQTSTRSLRSSSSFLLHVPPTKLRTMGDRAFCSVAPQLWNSLPLELRETQSLDSFKVKLKTYLFKNAYSC